MLALLLSLAFADPPISGDSPEEPDDVYEIIVYDQLAVELARHQVIERLDEVGYSQEIERDGYTIYRHADPWRGDVRVHDDGYVQVKRQPVRLVPPIGRAGSPLGAISCVVLIPLCTRFGGQTIGRRKLQAQKTAVVQFLDPELDDWGDRIADRELGSRLLLLPDEMERLWFEGVPLNEGEPELGDVDARKAALLAYWDSRTNTVWGDRTRLTVEGFLRAVVQTSETPFTLDELTSFNAGRTASRSLDLSSSWEAVSESVLPAGF